MYQLAHFILTDLCDHHLPPAGRYIAGYRDVGVALAVDDVDVVVERDGHEVLVQPEGALVPVALDQQIEDTGPAVGLEQHFPT